MDPVADLVDRFRLVQKLRLLHWQQVSLGLFVTMAAMAYNLVTPRAQAQITAATAITAGVLFMLFGAAMVWIRVEGCRRRMAAPAPTPRERALRLAEGTSRIGSAWLTWTTMGNLVLGLGTVARLRLSWEPEALLLWFSLLPAIGLVLHGIANVPTRERLLAQ